jgi:predicted negative regulator of RcsB-dependent stress response
MDSGAPAPAIEPDGWRRLEAIFQAAADLPPADRPAFLTAQCGDDLELRKDVDSLLASLDQTHGFIVTPLQAAAQQVAGAKDPSVSDITPGTHIGPYQLVKTLGEGGMGKVYLAIRADQIYVRGVAIKVMRSGFGSSPVMLARFRNERQILANLDHPNIARLLDGGVTEQDAPYLVMEYIDGKPIDEYCWSQSLPIEQRLRMFIAVCSAVEYAHNNLVVHRDIKPANILVAPDGVPKLLDFGIAKMLDPELGDISLTRPAERPMTPEYASPEQIRGEPVTTATDVYGLGILLYELLAGMRPFRTEGRDQHQVARMICEEEALPPSATRARNRFAAPLDPRRLKGDVDRIVLMAIRKEPARRYASVAQFAADVEAYLDGYPVRARTDAWGYRSGKFVRRHKFGVAATAFAALALVGVSIAMTVLAKRATREQSIAQREAQFMATMFQAATPEVARGRTITARDLLDQGAQRLDRELAGEPEVRASMADNIALAYHNLGLADRALPVAENAYRLNVKTHGANSPEAASSLQLLASLYRDQGKYATAEPLFRQLVAIRRKTLGPSDAKLAESLAVLGECLYLENKDAESEPPLREALQIYRKDGPGFGSEARNYLALVVERKGQYPEAAELLREATQIDLRTKGADSPDYANSLSNYATDLIDFGDYAAAENKLREALTIRRKILGNDHPDLGYPLNNLAFVLIEEGEAAKAEPLAREAVALRLKNQGPNHPQIAAARNTLGRVLEAEGDLAGAESEFGQALDIVKRTVGFGSYMGAQILLNHAALEYDRGQYQTAEKEAGQSLDTLRKLGGEKTPYVASALIQVAEGRVLAGDASSAVPMLRQALEIRREEHSATHPDTVLAEVRLGEALTASRKLQEAEQTLRTALKEVRSASFAFSTWRIAEIQSALGACLAALGDASGARDLLEASQNGLRTDPHSIFRKLSAARLQQITRQ